MYNYKKVKEIGIYNYKGSYNCSKNYKHYKLWLQYLDAALEKEDMRMHNKKCNLTVNNNHYNNELLHFQKYCKYIDTILNVNEIIKQKLKLKHIIEEDNKLIIVPYFIFNLLNQIENKIENIKENYENAPSSINKNKINNKQIKLRYYSPMLNENKIKNIQKNNKQNITMMNHFKQILNVYKQYITETNIIKDEYKKTIINKLLTKVTLLTELEKEIKEIEIELIEI